MNTGKQRGSVSLKPSSHLISNLFWTVMIGLSVVLIVIFGLSTNSQYGDIRTAAQLQVVSDEVFEAVQEKLQALDQKNRLVIEKGVLEEDLVERVKRQLPETVRVLLVPEPVFRIKPEPTFPGINFATLDMLIRASNAQSDPPPEIHLFGQKDQYLNYVYIVEPEEKYLVLSYPVDAVLDLDLSIPSLEAGTVVLRQNTGRYSQINLKHWGNLSAISSSKLPVSLAVPNSNFYVEYFLPESFSILHNIPFAAAIIGLLFSILLLITALTKKSRASAKSKSAAADTEKRYVPRSPTVKDAAQETALPPAKDQPKLPENAPTVRKPALTGAQAALPDPSIFKAYDIRGIVDETLTRDTVKQIGQAIGTENQNRGCEVIAVARDGRLSGPSLLDALIEGLTSSGCDVVNIGAVPTGVLYFATHYLKTGSGVMLTGSHNPPDYNGLKIMLNGETLSGKQIKDLYNMIKAGNLKSGEGQVQELDIADDYIEHISSDIQLEHEPKVVVDSGNGIAGPIAVELLEEIGCEVIPLNCEVDGHFPNHHPDPSVPENLKDLITTLQNIDADIGIAFDGDGDRLGVVTKAGEIIYPDRLLMLFARDVLTRQPGSSVIFDVKCTGHLPKMIVQSGGMPIMWKTGHSFMKAKLKETEAALAGEMSGHFFFNERWFGFDDGIYSAARLLEILDQDERDPQDVFDELPKGVSTPEIKVEMAEGEHYKFMEKFQNSSHFKDAKVTTIDGIRADFGDGWGLVRCSNTTPCLVIRFDADDEAALKRIKEQFRKQILKIDETLELPF